MTTNSLRDRQQDILSREISGFAVLVMRIVTASSLLLCVQNSLSQTIPQIDPARRPRTGGGRLYVALLLWSALAFGQDTPAIPRTIKVRVESMPCDLTVLCWKNGYQAGKCETRHCPVPVYATPLHEGSDAHESTRRTYMIGAAHRPNAESIVIGDPPCSLTFYKKHNPKECALDIYLDKFIRPPHNWVHDWDVK